MTQTNVNRKRHLRLDLNIQETVRDRALVTKDHQQAMAYGESNGHVTDDVTWPWKVKLVTPIRLEHNILKTAVKQYGRLS